MSSKTDRGMAKFCMKCPRFIILYGEFGNECKETMGDCEKLNGVVLIGCDPNRDEGGWLHYKHIGSMKITVKDHATLDYKDSIHAVFRGASQLPPSLRDEMMCYANRHGCCMNIDDRRCCLYAERVLELWNK